jgi:hypothetical protein
MEKIMRWTEHVNCDPHCAFMMTFDTPLIEITTNSKYSPKIIKGMLPLSLPPLCLEFIVRISSGWP